MTLEHQDQTKQISRTRRFVLFINA